jgi:hypothetical protein
MDWIRSKTMRKYLNDVVLWCCEILDVGGSQNFDNVYSVDEYNGFRQRVHVLGKVWTFLLRVELASVKLEDFFIFCECVNTVRFTL